MEWIILLLVIVGVVAFIVGIYNRLVAARNAYKNAFAQIDVQLTRRYDLIPNLVEIAKGYLKHERETLEAVIKARNAAVDGLKGAAADPEALREEAARHIARYKLPKDFVFRPKIERSPSGKADYRWAKAQAEAGAEAGQ